VAFDCLRIKQSRQLLAIGISRCLGAETSRSPPSNFRDASALLALRPGLTPNRDFYLTAVPGESKNTHLGYWIREQRRQLISPLCQARQTQSKTRDFYFVGCFYLKRWRLLPQTMAMSAAGYERQRDNCSSSLGECITRNPLPGRPANHRMRQSKRGESQQMKAQKYVVFINFVHNKSVAHVEDCGSVKGWGGETTALGGWLGPYPSRQDAERVGQLSGKPFHWCGRCHGESSLHSFSRPRSKPVVQELSHA
jgi:hypothetical protein